MAKYGKGNEAWKKLFQERPIATDLAQQGYHLIQAQDLKRYMEPRLLAKVDNSMTLPKVLREYDCAPLSISSNTYVLLRPAKTIFHELETLPTTPIFLSPGTLETKLQTIPWNTDFTGESLALDTAFLTGIFRHFLHDSDLNLTIRGRRTLQQELPLRFRNIQLPVKAKSVQMEIDAGYESITDIYLVEAKIGLPKDFNIRQLFFPYHYWRFYLQQRQVIKPIHIVFFAYSSHSFYLFRYSFTDITKLDSLQLVESGWYILGSQTLTWKTIKKSIETYTQNIAIPQIPFPQADDFARVLDVVNRIARQNQDDLSDDDIAEWYDFTPRQGGYYPNAACWLGWLEYESGAWRVTTAGQELSDADLPTKLHLIIHAMAQRPVLRESLQWMAKSHALPARKQIEEWIIVAVNSDTIKPISKSTIPRRARTIEKWLKYIESFVVEQAKG